MKYAPFEVQYLKTLESLLKSIPGSNRTGVDASQRFGVTIKHDWKHGAPVLRSKKVHMKSVLEELYWFLSGATNAKPLEDQGVTIWKEWGDPVTREMGPIYGKQWRDFGGVDQIDALLRGLVEDPFSRRLIVSAWNPPELDAAALPPCHLLFQCHTEELSPVRRGVLDIKRRKLHMTVYQRSADWFLGVPFNLASYGALQYLICVFLNQNSLLEEWSLGTLTFTFGNAHLYSNHQDAAQDQLDRLAPLDGGTPYYWILVRPQWSANLGDELASGRVKLLNYHPHPTIKGDVAP